MRSRAATTVATLLRRNSSDETLVVVQQHAPALPPGLEFAALEGVLMAKSSKSSFKSAVISSAWKPRYFVLSDDTLRWYTHRRDGVECDGEARRSECPP